MSSYYEQEALTTSEERLGKHGYKLKHSLDGFQNDRYTIVSPKGVDVYESANAFCISAYTIGLLEGLKN